jgi:hypothetical protein
VGEPRLQLELLPGAPRLLAAHAEALPQRDDLCGAFCGALALHAAHIERHAGQPIDQDAVALAAGSLVSARPEAHNLPQGEHGRRDYRLALPTIEDAAVSGTTAAGLVHAVQLLSDDVLEAIPYEGPWTPEALDGIFEVLAASEQPVSVIANVATRHLWGARASVAQMLAHLLEGTLEGPPPDWDVGHFVCLVGRVRGPGGTLYAVADTYPSLGLSGVHVQPRERLATALRRPQMAAGGALLILAREDAPALRARASELGLCERAWDNGTILPETLA